MNLKQQALSEKVSRERFGIEIKKMLSGKDPSGAFDLMRELQIDDVVFQLFDAPEEKDSKNKQEKTEKKVEKKGSENFPKKIVWEDERAWKHSVLRMKIMKLKHWKDLESSEELKEILMLASFLGLVAPLPNEKNFENHEKFENCAILDPIQFFFGFSVPNPIKKSQNPKEQSVISFLDEKMLRLDEWMEQLVFNSIRMPKNLSQRTARVIYFTWVLEIFIRKWFGVEILSEKSENEKKIKEFSEKFQKFLGNDKNFRLFLGHWLRKIQNDYQLCCYLFDVFSTKSQSKQIENPSSIKKREFDEIDEIEENYLKNYLDFEDKVNSSNGMLSIGDAIIKAIKTSKFEEVMNMKSLLNGKEVSTVLNMKPGPKFKTIIDDIMNFQIENFFFEPKIDKENLTIWLKSKNDLNK